MKKLILLFTMATALAMTGCGLVSRHYPGKETFNIVNQTDFEMILIRGFGDVEGTSDLTISQGEEIIALERGARCEKNQPPDDYPENYQLPSFGIRRLKLDGKIVHPDIWLRKYWDVVREVYHSTYTLTITDELIERVGFVEEQ